VEKMQIEIPDEDDIPFCEVAAYLNVPLITGNIKHFPKCKLVTTARSFLEQR
jgi:hypothetical protein